MMLYALIAQAIMASSMAASQQPAGLSASASEPNPAKPASKTSTTLSGVTITIPRIVPPDEKVVCKIEPITGSRFLVKQCRTQEEWSQITAQAQEQVRSFQMRAEQFALKSH